MKTELIKIKKSEKFILRQLIELYEYDFSEYTGEDCDEYGFYGYTWLDHYWTDDTRHPYLIKCDGKLCGFVMVNAWCYALRGQEAKSIAEFFIMKKYRRRGIGSKIACQVFDMFPGKWEVNQVPANKPSYIFWEKVIGDYTKGNFEKSIVDTEDGKKQAITFNNA